MFLNWTGNVQHMLNRKTVRNTDPEGMFEGIIYYGCTDTSNYTYL